jgi:hypothetical protein
MRQALLKGAASEPAAMTRGILVLSGLNSRDRAQNIPAAANGKTGQLVSGSSSSRSPFAETSLNPSQIEREFGKSRSNVHREKSEIYQISSLLSLLIVTIWICMFLTACHPQFFAGCYMWIVQSLSSLRATSVLVRRLILSRTTIFAAWELLWR